MLLHNFYRYFVKFSLFRYLTYIYRIIYNMAQFPFFNKHFLLHLSRGYFESQIFTHIFILYTHFQRNNNRFNLSFESSVELLKNLVESSFTYTNMTMDRVWIVNVLIKLLSLYRRLLSLFLAINNIQNRATTTSQNCYFRFDSPLYKISSLDENIMWRKIWRKERKRKIARKNGSERLKFSRGRVAYEKFISKIFLYNPCVDRLFVTGHV